MILREMKIAVPVLQPWLQLLITKKNKKNVQRINAEILGNCGGKMGIIIRRTKILRVKLGLTVKHSTLC